MADGNDRRAPAEMARGRHRIAGAAYVRPDDVVATRDDDSVVERGAAFGG